MKNTTIRFWIIAFTMLLSVPIYAQVTVWPGDVNNDGVVNTVDVLYLGVGFNTQGPVRNNQGIVWQASQGSPWNDILPDSTNYAYLDCDGNGFVGTSDFNAIQQNYDSTHGTLIVDPFPTPDSLSPVFYFSGLPDSLRAGDTITLDIFAGNVLLPANFFGVALSFNYDTSLIVANSVSATPDSLLDAPIDRVFLLSTDNNNSGTFDLAITRLANSGGSSGNPITLASQRLLSISFIIEDNLIGKMVAGPLELSLSNIRMTSKDLLKSSGNTDAVSLPFVDVAASAPILQFDKLRVYPQPTSAYVIIDGLMENGFITLTDLTGNTITYQSVEKDTRNNIDCTQLAAGMYLLHIETRTGSIVKKILVEK
jgi:hypothetical protein